MLELYSNSRIIKAAQTVVFLLFLHASVKSTFKSIKIYGFKQSLIMAYNRILAVTLSNDKKLIQTLRKSKHVDSLVKQEVQKTIAQVEVKAYNSRKE